VTPTILLADDDENDRLLFVRTMRSAGFGGTINTVSDGTDAVRYLSGLGEYSNRELFPMPTLLLLDIRMRNLGGLDTLRKLRERGAWADIPIAVLSGFADLPEVKKAYALGARTFFMKPIEAPDAVQICSLAGQPNPAQNIERRNAVRP
jgi:CheY-like chemotaxis protein